MSDIAVTVEQLLAPTVQVNQASGTKVSVTSQPAHKVVATSVGIQGATGEPGTDYGWVFASRSTPAQPIFEGVRAEISIDPTSTIDRLKGLFAGHSFISENRIQPRAVDDFILIEIRLEVTSTAMNTQLTIDLDIGGSFGIIERRDIVMPGSAGETLQVTPSAFAVFTGSTFLANGGAIYITATSDVTIDTVDFRILPESGAL